MHTNDNFGIRLLGHSFCDLRLTRQAIACGYLPLSEAQPLDIDKQFVYNAPMIQSFASAETARIFATGKSRRLPQDILKRAAMRLTQLDGAVSLDDLRIPPSSRLEALSHDRAGQWSIRINDQWRICFRFENGDAYDVEIVDYH